jgi:hypothetical protein
MTENYLLTYNDKRACYYKNGDNIGMCGSGIVFTNWQKVIGRDAS